MPSGTSRSTPAKAVVDPNRLTTPATLTAGGRLRRDPLVSGCLIAAVGALLVVRTVSRDRGQIDVANVRPVRPQLGLHVGQRHLDLGDGQRVADQLGGCAGSVVLCTYALTDASRARARNHTSRNEYVDFHL